LIHRKPSKGSTQPMQIVRLVAQPQHYDDPS
jgi:hypothetical protein